jgi:hypothetical protein
LRRALPKLKTIRGNQRVPTISHVLYIPGVLLIGIAIGFVLGARAARAEIARQNARKRR